MLVRPIRLPARQVAARAGATRAGLGAGGVVLASCDAGPLPDHPAASILAFSSHPASKSSMRDGSRWSAHSAARTNDLDARRATSDERRPRSHRGGTALHIVDRPARRASTSSRQRRQRLGDGRCAALTPTGPGSWASRRPWPSISCTGSGCCTTGTATSSASISPAPPPRRTPRTAARTSKVPVVDNGITLAKGDLAWRG